MPSPEHTVTFTEGADDVLTAIRNHLHDVVEKAPDHSIRQIGRHIVRPQMGRDEDSEGTAEAGENDKRDKQLLHLGFLLN